MSGEENGKIIVNSDILKTSAFEGWGTREGYLTMTFAFTVTTEIVDKPAQLKNTDGSLVDMVTGTTYTYTGGVWA